MMFHKPIQFQSEQNKESVWDYPRPPRLEKVRDKLRVVFGGEIIAETSQGYRVLETSHPPVYYFPQADVNWDYLIPAAGRSFCEFKGMAQYWSLEVKGARSEKAAWSYANPTEPFQVLANFVAFYASRVDSCWVGEERVEAQAGDFYGGWITSKIAGPFKGPPGTLSW